MSSIAEEFAARGFRADFRRYQRLALEHGRVAGDATCYVVMPPGAGKTVVGLELARRIGRRTLVLVPNTAVLGQWASTWDERFPAGDAREVAPCATDRSLDAPLTVLTYQSLAVIDDGHAAAERRCAVRGRDHEALLAMLHPNGRELVARAAASGPWTLVLDECHHLLDTWGALVGALVDELGAGTTVIGLTATPPRLLTGWQRELHDDLFGTADVEVPAPALVRDGDLAPYQELVYLTAPTPEEDGWLVTETARFADLQVELVDRRLGTVPLLTWVQRRVGDRCDPSGARRSWGGFERAEPALAVAVLRLAYAGILPVPDGARLREEHRVQPSSHDWVVVLADFCTGHMWHSEDPGDVAALASITRVLPGLGYRLTARGSQATTSPVDRLCGLSAAKVGAAAHILDSHPEPSAPICGRWCCVTSRPPRHGCRAGWPTWASKPSRDRRASPSRASRGPRSAAAMRPAGCCRCW